MKPPRLTPLEQKAVDVWKEKVYEGYGDTKYLAECDWGDMAMAGSWPTDAAPSELLKSRRTCGTRWA